jgi:soluble lytic murein transglycosylase
VGTPLIRLFPCGAGVFRRPRASLGCVLLLIGLFPVVGPKKAAAQSSAQIPAELDPVIRPYPGVTARALQSLSEGIQRYLSGDLDGALGALPEQDEAGATAVGDYALYYRGKALADAGRKDEALVVLRRCESRFPASSLLPRLRLAQARLLIAGGNGSDASALLVAPPMPDTAEMLYWRAQALEMTKARRDALPLYLRVVSEFVTSDEASLAAKQLLVLDPSYALRKDNYTAMLRRAGGLLAADRDREARALLVKLAGAPAPDTLSRGRRSLLLAQADLNLRRTADALAILNKIGPAAPDLHAQALQIKGAAYRRLDREKSLLAARDEAVRLYPESRFTEELLYSVATYYDSQSLLTAACENYRSIVEKFPRGNNRARAQFKLAIADYAAGRFGEALRGFRGSLYGETSGNSILPPAYWMARCHLKLGDEGRATYILRRVQAMGNNSYYGWRAAEALDSLAHSGRETVRILPGPDLDELRRRLDEYQPGAVSLSIPTGASAVAIERARQLASAGLADLALEELRSAALVFPDSKAIAYVSARIHAAQEDHLNAITAVRRAFPDAYYLQPPALPQEVWETLFPVKHWKPIAQEAQKNKLEAHLILAIIRQESAFQERARSRADARGLMQIRPATGRALARQAGLSNYATSRLYQAETNIALGARYLNSLVRRYDGKTELALAAYNAGDSRVDRWMRVFGSEDMATFVELIPFSETRAYVKQVMTNLAHYRLRTSSQSSAVQ